MNLLISYDIQSDRLRLKVAQQLIAAGLIRVQYSVFLGDLSKSAKPKLESSLTKWSNDKNWSDSDSILVLPLHQYSKEALEIVGVTPKDWNLITDRPETLLF